MKDRITRARKRIILVSILLIVVCVVVMLIPKDTSKDKGIVNEGAQITQPTLPEQEPLIKEEGAITTVLKKLKGSSASDIKSFSQEYGEGGWTYEGSIKVPKKNIVYEFQIDADLGTILKWEPKKAE